AARLHRSGVAADGASISTPGPRVESARRRDRIATIAIPHRRRYRVADGRDGGGSSGRRGRAHPRGLGRVGLPLEGAGVTSKLGHVTWTDLWNMAPRPIIAVPIGSCEQHGPHLPLDTDTRIATALAEG